MCGQTNFSFVCFVSIQYLTRSEISVEGCALHYLLEASSLGFRDSVSIGSSVGLLGLVRAFWHILASSTHGATYMVAAIMLKWLKCLGLLKDVERKEVDLESQMSKFEHSKLLPMLLVKLQQWWRSNPRMDSKYSCMESMVQNVNNYINLVACSGCGVRESVLQPISALMLWPEALASEVSLVMPGYQPNPFAEGFGRKLSQISGSPGRPIWRDLWTCYMNWYDKIWSTYIVYIV